MRRQERSWSGSSRRQGLPAIQRCSQLATASPNFLIQESMLDWSGFYADILQEPVRWEHGFIVPPTAPGLGVALNMEVVRAHSPYRGERLHLLMDPKPYDVAAEDEAWRQRWNHDKAL